VNAPTCPSRTRAGASPRTRAASALAAGLLLALCASPAAALTIDDVAPLFFDVVAQGFSPDAVAAIGRGADASITPSDTFLGAGAPSTGAPVLVLSQTISQVHQRPDPITPSNPAIVDSLWTLQNASGAALSAPLLLFTVLDPLGTYPGDPLIGLDANLLQLVSYSNGGPEILYGAVALPDLLDGESTQITVRYVVGGPLQVQNATQLIAPLGLAVAVTYTAVPEPSTLLLAMGGLMASARLGRNRPARRGTRSTRSVRCPERREPRSS